MKNPYSKINRERRYFISEFNILDKQLETALFLKKEKFEHDNKYTLKNFWSKVFHNKPQ